ncbi:MAG TPA: vWA domain-containing protein [Solirubrobacterales bacterium]|nr:vWA domain-containing protein [Solirubrobacterales bacterium]
MRRVAKVLLGTATAALIAAGPLAPSGGATPFAQTAASSCKQATNIEAIVDDSGSMEITDANRLRVQAMNLLIDTLGKSTQLGAVEFGSGLFETPGADTLFPPEPVGPNAAAMRMALDEKIHADNGATDYNAAFAQSDLDNPGADARIFLTDGGHDIGTYNEAHLTHNVPTYVIGFGGISLPEDQARLKKIAADSGGSYFPLVDSSQLQSVMNSVGAALTCQTPPRLFSDELAKGQSKLHSVSIGAATKSIQITLTWASPLDKFKVSGLRLSGPKGLIAVASRPQKPAKLKVTRTVSTTFAVLKVSHLRKGKLHFAVKATTIGSGAPKVSLTTQVGQSSHR